MNIGEMLVELKRQRRGLNQAIAALETLRRKPQLNRKPRSAARGATSEIINESRMQPRKNGTTGLLIPFSPVRNHK
jgi:hypothetical protein